MLLHERFSPMGVRISFHDESRPVAGDRWFVRLVCRIEVPVLESDLPVENGEGEALREALGRSVGVEFIRERNFIAAPEKEAVLHGLLADLERHAIPYLDNEALAGRLVRRRLAELGSRRCGMVALPAREPDDDPGPADFSACFREG